MPSAHRWLNGAPAMVGVSGRSLARVESLDDAGEGWRYLEKYGLLCVKVRHEQKTRVCV